MVRLERVNDEVLAVYGEENGGSPSRYIEIVDMKTGKTVGHKQFPRQQPEPKKEAKEEEAGKIDYQKMAQEARWKQPKDDAKQWTISISADGKKVYDWPVATPSGLFVDSNCVVYRPTFSPIRTGCDVIAYDLKGQKLLWRTHLEGLGPVPHSEYWNVVRLERVNDEVLAVYGDEAAGRYVEIVDMKTGKTVGHKVFPKKADGKEDEKKEGGTDAKAEAAAGQPMAPNIPPTISSKELVAEYLKDKKAAEKKYGGPNNPKELIVEGIVVWIGHAQAGIFVVLKGTEEVMVCSSLIPIGQEGGEKEGEKATIRGKCRGLNREVNHVSIDVGKVVTGKLTPRQPADNQLPQAGEPLAPKPLPEEHRQSLEGGRGRSWLDACRRVRLP